MLLKKAACAESKPRCVLLAALVRRDRAPTWCRHASHHTMSRTWVAAALPSVIADPTRISRLAARPSPSGRCRVWRRVLLRRRQWLVHGFRPDLGEDRL